MVPLGKFPNAMKIETRLCRGSFLQKAGASRKNKQPLDLRGPGDKDDEMGNRDANNFLEGEVPFVS